MEHAKSQSFANKWWWLFYPILFLLVGMLIYALLWSPDGSLDILRQELRDCREQHTIAYREQLDSIENMLPEETQQNQESLELDENQKAATVNCDAQVQSGGHGITKTKHIIGDQSGRIILQYDTKEIPDGIKVFYDGKLIADTKGLVSGAGQLEWKYDAAQNKPNFCYVEVSAPTQETVWEYIVNCPL
ncbi:hypothetical protein [Sphingobacterium paludis]|uniref:Uncharacterized protein n=1 Tax=Sphingobacterium paludis TaxID=1476465 RepID=A0A4R7CWU6_9SPHI|nr:hypothetical protein [Sphingobacterium paludis]TDS12357.1 hypothetical protein B0I21_106215 [Sphingobacterium paludis]